MTIKCCKTKRNSRKNIKHNYLQYTVKMAYEAFDQWLENQ